MEDNTLSLTDQIYQELVDGLKTGLDYTHLQVKYRDSKGPFYNAYGRLIRDMEPKVKELSAVQAELDAAGLKLDSLDQRIKEAENSLVPREERRNALSKEIVTLEAKLAEKRELLEDAGELGKRGFDTERLIQLREALAEIGAKNGITGKEAVAKFFDDLKDYGAVLEAKALLEGIQTQIETKKLEAKKWQAEEEAARRKHDDLKETIGAIYALRAKGMKDSQIIMWQQILSRFETVEQFDEYLAQYGDATKLLNANKQEAESYELRATKARTQFEIVEKGRAKIEAEIDALRVAGLKELKTMTEEAARQLKVVAANEIREAQTVGQEVRKVFANYFVQLDKLLEKAVHLGEELEKSKQDLQRYAGVKGVLESHAVAMEEVK